MKYRLCIVVPCYNEASSFRLKAYQEFVSNHDDVLLCFVNDGSSDETEEVLLTLTNTFKGNMHLLSYEKNQGKAGAVKKGMNFCAQEFDYTYIAYLDADLAVSLEECYSMIKYFATSRQFVFGSRIRRIGSQIERKYTRFFVGRIIATFISKILDIGVYDTQCGCKLLTKDLAIEVFEEDFISKWLFDVELFSRILKRYGKTKSLQVMYEVPLNRWVDHGDSKVKITYFFKLWVDLYRIKRAYQND